MESHAAILVMLGHFRQDSLLGRDAHLKDHETVPTSTRADDFPMFKYLVLNLFGFQAAKRAPEESE